MGDFQIASALVLLVQCIRNGGIRYELINSEESLNNFFLIKKIFSPLTNGIFRVKLNSEIHQLYVNCYQISSFFFVVQFYKFYWKLLFSGVILHTSLMSLMGLTIDSQLLLSVYARPRALKSPFCDRGVACCNHRTVQAANQAQIQTACTYAKEAFFAQKQMVPNWFNLNVI